jgi:hypothetical protein
MNDVLARVPQVVHRVLALLDVDRVIYRARDELIRRLWRRRVGSTPEDVVTPAAPQHVVACPSP